MTRFFGKLFVRVNVYLYRLTNGTGLSFGGRILLLTTTGARTGQLRVNPVMCVEIGNGELAVAASAGGQEKHPAWYHNIRANPQVEVQRGSNCFTANARIAEEPQRSHVYEQFEEAAPVFRKYQKKTKRVIPIILLGQL